MFGKVKDNMDDLDEGCEEDHGNDYIQARVCFYGTFCCSLLHNGIYQQLFLFSLRCSYCLIFSILGYC